MTSARSREDVPLVSCLCVTEKRAAFMPWLGWSFQRQAWPNKELVIVDSSPRPVESAAFAAMFVAAGLSPLDVRVIAAPPGTNVPCKRNLALDVARGEFIAFFDDDDWQHPERLTEAMRHAVAGADAVGTSSGWFVDLWGSGCRRHAGNTARLLFNGALFRRELAESVRFDERRRRASDTHWVRELMRSPDLRAARSDRDDLFFWLCHDQNLSNPRAKRRLDADRAELVGRIGERAWADTDERLEQLRAALGAPAASGREPLHRAPGRLEPKLAAASASGQSRAGRLRAPIEPRARRLGPWLDAPAGGEPSSSAGPIENAPIERLPSDRLPNDRLPSDRLPSDRLPSEGVEPRCAPGMPGELPTRPADEPRARPPVSMVIKATILDADYLGVMVPHMAAQAKHPLSETLIVVDPRLEFDGKYARRAKSSRAALDRVLGELGARGVIDRVVEATAAPGRVEEVLGRYFGPSERALPTHDVTGSPIFPALLGLEEARTDHVVLMDCDMFFHSSGESWVAAALDVLSDDAQAWLMMTQAGPPAGPLGTLLSLGLRNAARATWDERRRLWRFKSASTRYFLTDRRKLRGKLSALWRRAGLLPLETCISHSLERHAAYRGNLALEGSWDLHAHSHDAPFIEWAPAIAELVSRGVAPALQLGNYDLRLDRSEARAAWEALLRAG